MRLFINFLAFSKFTESEARRPNVILLNCDDFGIGDFQVYNREAKVPTPNIDRLANEGVNFKVKYKKNFLKKDILIRSYEKEKFKSQIVNLIEKLNVVSFHFQKSEMKT